VLLLATTTPSESADMDAGLPPKVAAPPAVNVSPKKVNTGATLAELAELAPDFAVVRLLCTIPGSTGWLKASTPEDDAASLALIPAFEDVGDPGLCELADCEPADWEGTP
jgi:hypothetical protein